MSGRRGLYSAGSVEGYRSTGGKLHALFWAEGSSDTGTFSAGVFPAYHVHRLGRGLLESVGKGRGG